MWHIGEIGMGYLGMGKKQKLIASQMQGLLECCTLALRDLAESLGSTLTCFWTTMGPLSTFLGLILLGVRKQPEYLLQMSYLQFTDWVSTVLSVAHHKSKLWWWITLTFSAYHVPGTGIPSVLVHFCPSVCPSLTIRAINLISFRWQVSTPFFQL